MANSQSASGGMGSRFLKGLNSNLIVRTGQTFRAPRTITAVVRELLFNPEGQAKHHEGTASVTYDQKATVSANDRGATIDDVLQGIEQIYVTKGYIKAEF